MIDVETLLKNDAYKNISDEQKELLRELLVKIEGKSGFEVMPLLMEYSKKVPKDTEYTKDEQTAMFSAFMEVLPENDRGVFGALLYKMNKM